jgi:Uma2 family endonuclease
MDQTSVSAAQRGGEKNIMVKTGVTLMTLDQFIERYGEQGPFEIIGEEIVEMTPQITRSAIIAGALFFELTLYLKTHPLGRLFSEAPFVLTAASNWVKGSRVPDVMFVRAERLAQLAQDDPDWQDKPLTIVPDLVAEIVSPTDKMSDVDKKIARYLDDGVRVVWVIEPSGQTVTIHTAGSKQLMRLTAEDTLSGGEVIPGFELAVTKLFE